MSRHRNNFIHTHFKVMLHLLFTALYIGGETLPTYGFSTAASTFMSGSVRLRGLQVWDGRA